MTNFKDAGKGHDARMGFMRWSVGQWPYCFFYVTARQSPNGHAYLALVCNNFRLTFYAPWGERVYLND